MKLAHFAVLSGIMAPMAALAETAFVIGVENTAYLPAYTTENGEYKGYMRDLLDQFAHDKGYRFDYRPLPVPRLYATFFSGQVDFKLPDAPEWQQDSRKGHDVIYSDPLAAYVDGANVLPEFKDAKPEQIRTLGTVSGFTPWGWTDAIKSNRTTLTENASFAALVQQVLAKRIDAAYASVAVVNYQLDKLHMAGALVFNDHLPSGRGFYRLSSLNHPDVIRELNDWLRQNHAKVMQIKAAHRVEQGISQ